MINKYNFRHHLYNYRYINESKNDMSFSIDIGTMINGVPFNSDIEFTRRHFDDEFTTDRLDRLNPNAFPNNKSLVDLHQNYSIYYNKNNKFHGIEFDKPIDFDIKIINKEIGQIPNDYNSLSKYINKLDKMYKNIYKDDMFHYKSGETIIEFIFDKLGMVIGLDADENKDKNALSYVSFSIPEDIITSYHSYALPVGSSLHISTKF